MKVSFDLCLNATEIAPTPMPSPDALLDALAQAGYSNTRSRRAVLMAICEAGGQASGAELLALGRAHHPPLGLVTVYRTLDLLLSLGLVRKLHLAEGCHTYALSLAGKHDEAHGMDRAAMSHTATAIMSSASVATGRWSSRAATSTPWSHRWKRRPASECRSTGWRCSASAPHARQTRPQTEEVRIATDGLSDGPVSLFRN